MPRHAIVFNDEWVPPHSPERLGDKAIAARQVVDAMKTDGVFEWSDGALGRDSCIGSALPGPSGATLTSGQVRERPEWLGGLCVVEVADDGAALAWAARLADALDWPQEVHRFPSVDDAGVPVLDRP